VEPELAAALEGREQEFNRKLSEQGRELGELRTWRRQVEPQLPPRPPPQEYDYDTALFERPREALMRFKQEIVQDLTSRYEGDQAQQRFWAGFYKEHPDLVDEERLVQAVARDLAAQGWSQEPMSRLHDFAAELAQQTRSELLRIARKTREREAPGERLPSGRVPVEGGSRGRAPAEPAEPQAPPTISGLLEARRRARQRAVTE
jgi:hypothetical protein